MKTSHWILTICLLFAAAVTYAGDIQVLCEPGLRVYLDGEFVGTSSVREDGLVLLDVARGTHTIRIDKDGHESQTFEVAVANLPAEVKVSEWVPVKPKATQLLSGLPKASRTSSGSGNVKRLGGNLIITSAPQNCDVEVDGKHMTKTTPHLTLPNVTVGDHAITFSKPGFKTISKTVRVHPGAEVMVRGNLTGGEVNIIHEGKGSLRVISTPMRCTIKLGDVQMEKIYLRLNRGKIPAGEYPFVAKLANREIKADIVIRKDFRTIVTLNFMPGKRPIEITYEPL